MGSTIAEQSPPLNQRIRDVSIQIKLTVPMLAMLGLLLIATIVTNLYAIEQFDAQVSIGRLNQEQELIRRRIDAEEAILTERALAITLDEGLLQAITDGDHNSLQRLGVQLRVRYQLDFLNIVDRDNQFLFGNQEIQPAIDDDLKLALATIENTRILITDGRAFLIAAVPLKGTAGIQGAILIGRAIDNSFLQQINSNRSDPIIRFYAPDGQFLASSAAEQNITSTIRLDPPLIRRILAGERIERNSAENGSGAQRIFYVALNSGSQAGLIYSLILSSTDIEAYRSRTLQQSTVILVIIGLITGGMLVLIIRAGIVSPLQRLSTAAEQLGTGNLEFHLKPGGHDEIGRLTSSFSAMVAQLKQSFTTLESRNQILEHEIDERKRAEALREQLQTRVNQAHTTIMEMSTPIIPIDDQTLVMPLIGSIDSQRAGQAFELLVRTVSASRARVAILDITGVPVVDTEVAGVLLNIAMALRLLGTRMILTGIRPEVAQSLVGLGVELDHISTYATLQQAIAAVHTEKVIRQKVQHG